MKNIKFKTKNPLLVVVIVLGIIAFISGCYAFSSWVVMTLFNLVAAYFGWKKITFIFSSFLANAQYGIIIRIPLLCSIVCSMYITDFTFY
jgi:hypothetical protein